MTYVDSATASLSGEGVDASAEAASIAGKLCVGVLIVDQHLNVAFANEIAQRILMTRGVDVRTGGKLSGTPAAFRRIQGLVSALIKGQGAGAALLDEEDGLPPVAIIPDGVQTSPERGWRASFWLVDISDLHVDCQWISEVFGLTRAEQQVLSLLVSGLSPEGIADALGASVATIRTHLQRTYAKTNTGSQAKLVRLACAIPRRPPLLPVRRQRPTTTRIT